MSTISQDPTTWMRNRKLQHDRHVRLARYVTGALHSHSRPVTPLPVLSPPDTPEQGYQHRE